MKSAGGIWRPLRGMAASLAVGGRKEHLSSGWGEGEEGGRGEARAACRWRSFPTSRPLSVFLPPFARAR